MIPYSFVQLEPIYWKQTVTGTRRASFSVNARLSKAYGSILISGARDVSAIPIDLTFVRGAYDWQIPEGSPKSIGFLAYHPEDEHTDSTFIGGGCGINDELFDESLERLKTSIYDSCTIHLEVAPVDYDGEYALWNREQTKFLYIQEVEISFVRKEKVKEEPPPKRGFFG
jgi:hypothetical protein